MSIDLILTGLLQGLILSFVAFSVMIPFRLLNFPDLTAEGTYPFGAAIYVSTLFLGFHPLFALFFSAFLAGSMSLITGLIHLRLKVNTLLAGIILSTMLYSINLRVMGKPNIALFNSPSLFKDQNIELNIFILILIIIFLILPFTLFIKTEFGLKLRAVGLNPDFARANSISVAKYTLLGLFLSGCFAGLAGGLIVQLQSYMDVGMGIGIVIHALAALMIGESIIGNDTLNKQLLAPLIGALIYQQIKGMAMCFGLAPSDLKLFTGIVVLSVIAFQKRKLKTI